jgi:hypothetical protein
MTLRHLRHRAPDLSARIPWIPRGTPCPSTPQPDDAITPRAGSQAARRNGLRLLPRSFQRIGPIPVRVGLVAGVDQEYDPAPRAWRF